MKDLSQNSDSQWEEARAQLNGYLRALQVTCPAQQERIVNRVMECAKAAPRAEMISPATAVMDALHQQMEQWFMCLLGAREHVTATGLVSFFAVDAPQR